MVSPRLRIAFGLCIALLMIGGPIGYRALQNRHFRGFHVVADGQLYRSAQLTPTGLKHVVHDYGIKTVICSILLLQMLLNHLFQDHLSKLVSSAS